MAKKERALAMIAKPMQMVEATVISEPSGKIEAMALVEVFKDHAAMVAEALPRENLGGGSSWCRCTLMLPY